MDPLALTLFAYLAGLGTALLPGGDARQRGSAMTDPVHTTTTMRVPAFAQRANAVDDYTTEAGARRISERIERVADRLGERVKHPAPLSSRSTSGDRSAVRSSAHRSRSPTPRECGPST